MLTTDGMTAIGEVWRAWETREKLSQVITLKEAQAADYNLSPSQFVDVNEKITHRAIHEIVGDLKAARTRRETADAHLSETLAGLHLAPEVAA